MGGGYSCKDTLTKGRFVLVVDAFSGELIRKLSLPAGNAYGPVAGSVTLMDFDKDGIADHLFAGDLKGNVWYFDVSDSIPANWHGIPNNNTPLFTDLPNRRPIFGGIALGAGAQGDTNWIFFGTGDRSNPYMQPNNRFYGMRVVGKNPPAIQMSDLDDVTGGGACNSAHLGWYINIPNADTSAVFTLPVASGMSDTVFTLGWRSPSGAAPACSTGSAGTTELYAFVKSCGNNTANWRRYAAGGMPPTEMPHGIDPKGNHKGVAVNKLINLGTYIRGKIVRSWREVY